MPGTFIHVASLPYDLQSSVLGLKGGIAPDFWKKHTPTEEEYLQFFDECPNAPSYEQVKLLCSPEHGGTHFGSEPRDTSHVNFALIAKLFESKQLDENNPFFKGYVHHLRVDKNFYANTSICDVAKFEKVRQVDKEKAIADLHIDWDKTNLAISSWYPEVVELVSTMPEKVQKVIGFSKGEPKYIALIPMHQFIQDMRKPRSLKELLNDE